MPLDYDGLTEPSDKLVKLAKEHRLVCRIGVMQLSFVKYHSAGRILTHPACERFNHLSTTFINGGVFCYSFIFMLIRPTGLTLV